MRYYLLGFCLSIARLLARFPTLCSALFFSSPSSYSIGRYRSLYLFLPSPFSRFGDCYRIPEENHVYIFEISKRCFHFQKIRFVACDVYIELVVEKFHRFIRLLDRYLQSDAILVYFWYIEVKRFRPGLYERSLSSSRCEFLRNWAGSIIWKVFQSQKALV